LPRDRVAGFVCDVGSKTSHTAIIAKALEIPSVVGLHEISYRVKEGDFLIVDGCWGEVIINPDEEEKARYKNNKAEFFKLRDRLSQLSCYIPGRTKEGFRIPIRGNLESHIEIELLKKEGAEGIGLYRTEFLFLNRLNLPTEEEQFEAYKEVVERFNPNPVTIRTLDLGGDKFLSPAKTPLEINPLLGVRAIRFCLKNKEIFLTQLKAILRASAYGKVQILLPLITTEEEIKETKELIKEAMKELRSQNIKFEEYIPIGVMLETPAAALTVDILAPHVDFFSLGTNDLIQYVFAVDRSNEEMNDLLEPYHPSIIRLIKGVIETAHSYGKEVGICGELASEPAYAVLLTGMGLDELSMSGISIMKVKEVLKRISLEEAYNLACNTLNSKNSHEIKEMLAPYEK
jgi:phosphotransferase system enzyme I (PtsI)